MHVEVDASCIMQQNSVDVEGIKYTQIVFSGKIWDTKLLVDPGQP